MTLNLNSYKKMARAQPLDTVHMTIYPKSGQEVARFATKVARKWAKVARFYLGISAVARLSLECQVIVFPQFLRGDQDL